MAVVEQLIRAESDGSVSFGNYKLPEKKKLENFEHNGSILKVKTYKDITKLEKDENFVYESVPGTAVTEFAESDKGVEFKVEGDTDPEFPGGEVFLQAYLKKKLLHSDVSGKGDVVISFKVDKKGNIYGAEVTKSAGSTLDTAAFNIVTGMPRWRPGLTNGQPADKPASVTVSFGKQ